MGVLSEFMPRLSLVQDVSPAAWLSDAAVEHGEAHSFIPACFAAYAQILHPADTTGEEPVTWQAIADWLDVPLRLWDGWGFLSGSLSMTVGWPADNPPPPGTPSLFHAEPAFGPEILEGPKVQLPTRDYLLFEGPLEAAGELDPKQEFSPYHDRNENDG